VSSDLAAGAARMQNFDEAIIRALITVGSKV
jgi:hypothetical protein